jgi:hypothetical protein
VLVYWRLPQAAGEINIVNIDVENPWESIICTTKFLRKTHGFSASPDACGRARPGYACRDARDASTQEAERFDGGWYIILGQL